MWICSPTLVVAEMVMLCEILQGEGLIVLTEAEQLIEKNHFDVNIISDTFVEPGECSRTVD